MSARGTITSDTESSPKVSRFASIRRSCELKSWVSRSLSSITSSRLSRMVESLRNPLTAWASRAAISPSSGRGAVTAAARPSAGSIWREVEALGTEADFGSESAGMARSLSCFARPRTGTRRIGVGDAETGEHAGLERLHETGILGLFVIVTGEMQNTVHHQMRGMGGEALALG